MSKLIKIGILSLRVVALCFTTYFQSAVALGAPPAPVAGQPQVSHEQLLNQRLQNRQANPPSYLDPSTHHEGIGYLYNAANEGTSTYSLYIIEKYKSLKGATKTEKKQRLGKFCFAAEDGDECFERFTRFNRDTLKKAQYAITSNQNEMAKLRDTRVVHSDGSVTVEGVPRFGTVQEAKKNLTPYAPTFDDLVAESAYQGQEHFQKMNTNQYMKEAAINVMSAQPDWTNINANPNPQDLNRTSEPALGNFVLFESVQRPDGQAMDVPASKCPAQKTCECTSGTCYDLGAYNVAMQKYKQDEAGYKKDFERTFSPNQQDALPKHMADLQDLQKGRLALDQGTDEVNNDKAAYNLARAKVIHTVNQQIEKSGLPYTPGMHFGKNNRNPQSAPTPVPTATPVATPTPAPTATPNVANSSKVSNLKSTTAKVAQVPMPPVTGQEQIHQMKPSEDSMHFKVRLSNDLMNDLIDDMDDSLGLTVIPSAPAGP